MIKKCESRMIFLEYELLTPCKIRDGFSFYGYSLIGPPLPKEKV